MCCLLNNAIEIPFIIKYSDVQSIYVFCVCMVSYDKVGLSFRKCVLATEKMWQAGEPRCYKCHLQKIKTDRAHWSITDCLNVIDRFESPLNRFMADFKLSAFYWTKQPSALLHRAKSLLLASSLILVFHSSVFRFSCKRSTMRLMRRQTAVVPCVRTPELWKWSSCPSQYCGPSSPHPQFPV